MYGLGQMTPEAIPRPQTDRVALFEAQFGQPFSSQYNAYWSLRQGRPVTLAEGADLDRQYKAGLIAPPAHVAVRAQFPQAAKPEAIPTMQQIAPTPGATTTGYGTQPRVAIARAAAPGGIGAMLGGLDLKMILPLVGVAVVLMMRKRKR